MTRTTNELPTRVPCAVCLIYIDGWAPHGDTWTAIPCGHTPGQARQIGETLTRVLPDYGPTRTHTRTTEQILADLDRLLEPDVLVCHPTRETYVQAAVAECTSPDLYRIVTSTTVPTEVVLVIPARSPDGDPTPLPVGDPTTDPRWRNYAAYFARITP